MSLMLAVLPSTFVSVNAAVVALAVTTPADVFSY